ncbi:MAG: alcohol dehydrogenase catalytic domain-containing protein [Clostridiales bacterium]|nr:alcohol dehydrogenase catalytic domain-containing protein [Clostridiales bacterium]
MKALMKLKPGAGNVELVDIPEPVCTPDGVKIEVKYTGICGTDIHVYHDRFKNYPPVILGHEFSGVVVETGGNVKKIKTGDRVTVLGSTMVKCGTCEYCVQGNYMFCEVRRGMGHGVNGSFTKYVVVREDMAYKLPDSVSFEEGALTEAFASAVQAIEELTKFNIGDTVLLSGPGPIGLLCLVLIVAHNCKVIVAGTGEDSLRLETAKELGADIAVNVTAENIDEIIERETGGTGVDIAVECSGSAHGVGNCLKQVKKKGKYVQVGITGKDITVNFDTILYKQLQVYGCLGHSLKTWERTMKILQQRKIDLTPLITHKLPLSKWREGFDLCEKKQGIKVLLSYDE